MTIDHQVKLEMSDVINMLKDKLGMEQTSKLDNVIITDYSPPEEPEDIEGVGIVKETDTANLVKKSNIVKALKEGLKGAGFESKFPKDAKQLCEDCMEEALSKMSTREGQLFVDIINTSGFTKFSILWQKYQTVIQKQL